MFIHYYILQDARNMTFPSITATHEFVVPKSIPMTSFPAGFALKQENSQ